MVGLALSASHAEISAVWAGAGVGLSIIWMAVQRPIGQRSVTLAGLTFFAGLLHGAVAFERPLARDFSVPGIFELEILEESVREAQQLRSAAQIRGAWSDHGDVLNIDPGRVSLRLGAEALEWLPQAALHPGERWRMAGKLHGPRGFANPGAVDVALRARRERRLGNLFIGQGPLWRLHAAPSFWSRMTTPFEIFRQRIFAAMRETLPERTAGLEAALLLGLESAVPAEVWRAYARCGVAHVLAISGQNFTLIVAALYAGLLWLFRRSFYLRHHQNPEALAFAATLPCLLGVLLLCGYPPSAVRAVLMLSACLWARFVRRGVRALNVLGAVALLTLIFDPGLLWQASWQLSFAAVAAILLGFDVHPVRGFWATTFWMTLWATLGTLPLVILHFGQVSLVGLGLNFIVVPFMNLLALPALLLSLPAFFFKALGVCTWIWVGVGFYLEHLTRFLLQISAWPWSALTLRPFLGFEMGLLFAAVGFALAAKKSFNRFAIVALVLVTVLCGGRALRAWRESQRFWIEFLDVGHGDAICLHLPGQGSLLIDGGGLMGSSFDLGRYVWLPYLRVRGIDRLSALVVTHPHPDHFLGFVTLLSEISAPHLYFNGDRDGPKPWRDFLASAEAHAMAPMRPHPGERLFEFNGGSLEVIYPGDDSPRGWDGPSVNNRSLVALLTVYGRRILLTGDIEAFGENWLLAQRPDLFRKPLDLLKVPHHGSRSSSGFGFLDALHPKAAVASAGWLGAHHFPHPETRERYAQRGIALLTTEECGAIQLEIESSGAWRWRTQKPCAAVRGISD